VLDIIRKTIFFGFYELFILFTKLAIFNCDAVFFFVHFHASWFFGAQFGIFNYFVIFVISFCEFIIPY
jgi:hypothetical protein